MQKYSLEFILNTQNDITLQTLKSSIFQFGENLDICLLPTAEVAKEQDFRICIHTEDPTIIFDACSQFGRLKSVKVNEIK